MPLLSVVAPAHNERENITALVESVGRALEACRARFGGDYEFVIVDDGSTDDTRAVTISLMNARPWLRCVAMQNTPPGRGLGQSAAFHAGVRAARGELIATIDADLQNDPADLPEMIALMRSSGADLVQGDRSRARRDSALRKASSWVGRTARRLVLGDTVRDTGCSLRVIRREIALQLPLELRGLHRFIPVSASRLGAKVVEIGVRHHPRHAGTSKYGFGLGRAIPGLIDLLAVRWMFNRRRPTRAIELNGSNAGAPGTPRVTDSAARVEPAATAPIVVRPALDEPVASGARRGAAAPGGQHAHPAPGDVR